MSHLFLGLTSALYQSLLLIVFFSCVTLEDLTCVDYICLCLYFQEGDRVVTKKEGIDFAREYGCLFIECSAKTRVNVQQCFEELVLKVR